MKLNRENNATIVIISHQERILRLADSVILVKGRRNRRDHVAGEIPR